MQGEKWYIIRKSPRQERLRLRPRFRTRILAHQHRALVILRLHIYPRIAQAAPQVPQIPKRIRHGGYRVSIPLLRALGIIRPPRHALLQAVATIRAPLREQPHMPPHLVRYPRTDAAGIYAYLPRSPLSRRSKRAQRDAEMGSRAQKRTVRRQERSRVVLERVAVRCRLFGCFFPEEAVSGGVYLGKMGGGDGFLCDFLPFYELFRQKSCFNCEKNVFSALTIRGNTID